MKRNVLNLFTVIFIAIAVVACKNNTEDTSTTMAEKTESAESTEVVAFGNYTVDTETSVITWKGSKPTGTHNGTIMIKNGEFAAKDGKVSSGSFVMDMSSIKDADGSERLEGHLKSADFFDIEKFPTATFEVTGMNENDGKMYLQGNLTMKENTNAVEVPVSISSEGDSFSISSETFVIDRSKWNVRYGSKSFFDDLGDKFIDNEIELTVSVKANKS